MTVRPRAVSPPALAVAIVAQFTFGIVLVTGRRMGPILWEITHERGVHLADLLLIGLAVPVATAWLRWIRRATDE